jgi:hypothetical protein
MKGNSTKKLTKEEFIIRAIKIHGIKYNYSLVEYVNYLTPIKITCSIHGEFPQLPKRHLKGRGCYKCGKIEGGLKNTKTKEKFIEESNKIHKYKYDYSSVNYIDNKTDVKIICPIHGEFKKNPSSHLIGSGCRKCYGNETKTTKQFILDAQKIHKNKYDYSLVEYINNKKEIKIICSIHGIFEQSPITHLKNHGCKKCADIIKGEHLRYTITEYINMSNKIHNNKYDYSSTNYSGIFNIINIICPKHGSFEQRASDHLRGNGCPTCSESNGEYIIRKILENNNIDFKSRKIFDNCKNIRCLPFDFYLPEFNTCIEYDGIQHFEPIDFFGGETALKSLKERDDIKNIFCEKYNINLIRIKYDENVKEKLQNYLIGLT